MCITRLHSKCCSRYGVVIVVTSSCLKLHLYFPTANTFRPRPDLVAPDPVFGTLAWTTKFAAEFSHQGTSKTNSTFDSVASTCVRLESPLHLIHEIQGEAQSSHPSDRVIEGGKESISSSMRLLPISPAVLA